MLILKSPVVASMYLQTEHSQLWSAVKKILILMQLSIIMPQWIIIMVAVVPVKINVSVFISSYEICHYSKLSMVKFYTVPISVIEEKFHFNCVCVYLWVKLTFILLRSMVGIRRWVVLRGCSILPGLEAAGAALTWDCHLQIRGTPPGIACTVLPQQITLPVIVPVTPAAGIWWMAFTNLAFKVWPVVCREKNRSVRCP